MLRSLLNLSWAGSTHSFKRETWDSSLIPPHSVSHTLNPSAKSLLFWLPKYILNPFLLCPLHTKPQGFLKLTKNEVLVLCSRKWHYELSLSLPCSVFHHTTFRREQFISLPDNPLQDPKPCLSWWPCFRQFPFSISSLPLFLACTKHFSASEILLP